jgi:hypothetical protein
MFPKLPDPAPAWSHIVYCYLGIGAVPFKATAVPSRRGRVWELRQVAKSGNTPVFRIAETPDGPKCSCGNSTTDEPCDHVSALLFVRLIG